MRALTLAELRERVEAMRERAQNAAERDLYRNVPVHKAQVEAFDEVLELLDTREWPADVRLDKLI